MPLCSACNSIPFRDIDRLIHSDTKTKLAAGVENVVWLNSARQEFHSANNKDAFFWPWMKHKTLRKFYDESPKCVLCHLICHELNTTPGQEVSHNSSTSAVGDSSGEETIWMAVGKDYIEVRHGTYAEPDYLWAVYMSVRSITGK
jgi:hypothetical protein